MRYAQGVRRAGHILAAQGLAIMHVDAVEVWIVVAAVLAVAADAVLVAHHLLKLSVYLVTARPVEEIAWWQEASGRKKGEGRGRCRGR